ncbi:MAG: transposase [Acidobacteria bacterium]|nr:transposase [Acidobacteriota bacterium]
MFQEVSSDPSALPGVVISVQSYGDRLNLHPHVHAIASRGVWSADGSFQAIPALDTRQLMLLFRNHLLENLLACGRIGQATLDILDRFHHAGFSAYEGEGVSADDSAPRERLASYLVHPPVALARLHHDRDGGIVTYNPRAPSRSHPSPTARIQFSPWMPWPL